MGRVAVNARAVNLAILLLLVLELASGLGSFLVGEPDGRWMFWLHRAGGLALVVLLFWKASIATRSYRRRGLRVGTGLSAAGGLLFLGSLATGVLWTTVGLPDVSVPVFGSWTVLSLHVALSLALIPLFLAHVGLRWPRPNRADLLGRRAALRMMGLLAAGFAVWGVQEFLSTLVAPSAPRRAASPARARRRASPATPTPSPTGSPTRYPGSGPTAGGYASTARSNARPPSPTSRSSPWAAPSGR